MKVYFFKTGGVQKVTNERDKTPWCSTISYRKNYSELTAQEQEEFHDWSEKEALLDQKCPATCNICGKIEGIITVRESINFLCTKCK